MSVSVVIPVTGDSIWDERAEHAAKTAYDNQIVRPNEVIIQRSKSVSAARNEGAERASSNLLIFLDADDELDPFYIQNMLRRYCKSSVLNSIYRPNTIGFYEDGSEDEKPVMIPRRDIFTGNYIVIGSMCRRDSFLEVGGFSDFPILEDWEYWIRCVKNGAKVIDVPEAIYRINVRKDSRNSQNPKIHGRVYSQIRKLHAKDKTT